MNISQISDKQLAKELQRFQASLSPIINPYFAEILKEIHSRLTGKKVESAKMASARPKRITKQDRVNKYFNM